MDSPTVLRRRLGSELRKMREAKSQTGAQVAKSFGWSESKVSRIESGKSPLADKDAKALLILYGVQEDDEVRQFLTLVRKSRQQGWWHSYGDALPDWFKPYLGFESDAAVIKNFETELVHGLLQTEAYARVVIREMSPNLTVEEIERRASARIQRQEILTSDKSPSMWAIINEAVVRRVVGSADIMRKQLEHLALVSETNPNVTVQVLPFEAGVHPALGYSFTHMTFHDVPGAIVYSEALTSATYLDKPAELLRHEEIFQRLTAAANAPNNSIGMLRKIAKEHGNDG